MRRLIQLLVFSALALASIPVRGADTTRLGEILRLPDSNPYRAILERYVTLPEDTKSRLSGWINSSNAYTTPTGLTDADRAIAHELASALVAASRETITERAWTFAPDHRKQDDFFADALPSVGPLRELGRISVKAAEDMLPSQSVEIYAAVARYGLTQRSGDSITLQLAGVALENIALAGATRRLNEYSQEELLRLRAAWRALPPPPPIAMALNAEREHVFIPMLERFVRPALHALLALHDNAGSEEPPFTRHLRLAGLLDLGGGERRISLEHIVEQTHFSIKEGETVEGIKLVSLDFEKRQAIIQRGHREAVIDLESKSIKERHLGPEQLRERLGGLGMISGGGDHIETRWLERVRSHPRGVDGCIDDLLADFDRKLARQVELASIPSPPKEEDGTADENTIVEITTSTLGKVARTFESSRTQATMLNAAIARRLLQLGSADQAAAPADPWSADGKGFHVEAASDGAGFTLTSRYEVRPGEPLTHKFAAPDAGFVPANKR